jgi:lysophospholipase L1-like esterase
MTRVIVFGASITYGAWDLEGGWVDRLKRFLHERTISNPDSHYLVYNQGVSGDTSDDVLERFEFETKMRLKEGEEIILIISVGTNDAQFIHDKNGMKVPPEKLKENIQKLIDMTRKVSQKIVFVGLLPVNESKTTPIAWDTNKSYKNEHVNKYNDIMKSVCRDNNVHFVGIFDKFMENDYKSMTDDGLHPDTKGHKMMFEIIRDFLVENKIV